MNDTQIKLLNEFEIFELLSTEDGMLKVAKAYCNRYSKAKLIELGIEPETLEDTLAENDKLSEDFNNVVDRITEKRYYRSVQLGIATLTKMLIDDINNPENVKLCREALSALDSVKRGCKTIGADKKKKSDLDKFQEAMKSLGV